MEIGCECDRMQRRWNPNSGVCETCKCRYVACGVSASPQGIRCPPTRTSHGVPVTIDQEAEGRDRMILVVTRDHEPRGRRVRVLPGVLGTMVGFAGGSTTVDVAVADLRRYLDRVGKELHAQS